MNNDQSPEQTGSPSSNPPADRPLDQPPPVASETSEPPMVQAVLVDEDDSNLALRVDQLVYNYRGHQALAGVSFAVRQQSIHGFVGPNGAGKTTTLKVISTLLRPHTGTVRVLGMDVVSDLKRIRPLIGFMPDHLSLYKQMTVFEYLDFFAAAYGQPIRQRNQTIRDVLELTDMESRKDDFIRSLSRGMMQRVSLARVLVHDPKLLLLDEPASGLDPRARIELMEILRELARMGKTIFISSHILGELASLCDEVTIIDRGQVRYTGSMQQLLRGGQQAVTEFELELAEPSASLVETLRQLPGVTQVEPVDGQPQYTITISPEQIDANTVLRKVLDCGVPVESFRPLRRQLDQVFMDLTEPGIPS